MTQISENIKKLKERIAAAANRSNRNLNDIKIIAVTKTASADEIKEAVSQGLADFGENRVQPALKKIEILKDFNIRWHMIGHLQSNKIKYVISNFYAIHSVDSISLAEEINKKEKEKDIIVNVLLEVNVANDPAKYGIHSDDVSRILEEIKMRDLSSIRVLGLMTMPPYSINPELSRPYFKKLMELAKANNLKELSMGTSQDFEVAIEEGATIIRVGREIFETKQDANDQ